MCVRSYASELKASFSGVTAIVIRLMPSPASAGLTEVSEDQRHDEIDISQTGPASKGAARGADHVAIGFDVRTRGEQRS